MYVSPSVVGISGSEHLCMLVLLDYCRYYSFCCRHLYFCQFVGITPSVVGNTVVTLFLLKKCGCCSSAAAIYKLIFCEANLRYLFESSTYWNAALIGTSTVYKSEGYVIRRRNKQRIKS